MTVSKHTTFYETFNARTLRPEEVAQSFVSSEAFRRLSRPCHSIMVGPRGSGKTTLLKMLEQPALESWNSVEAVEYRDRVRYTGVFIATDVSWKAQVEELGGSVFSDDEHRVFSSSAFTTHVLRSLVRAMSHRVSEVVVDFPHRRIQLPFEQQAHIVREIASSWRITPALPTLISLKHALTDRLTRIRELASALQRLGSAERASRLQEETFLDTWYFEATIAAIEIFNDHVGEPDAPWALLFDELELAPQWIREQLVASTRSVDSRVIFKLSMSPYDGNVHLDGMLAPMENHDYDPIALWYASREDGYAFCSALWQSMLQQQGIEGETAESTLGPSIFDVPLNEVRSNASPYGPSSRHSQRFQQLASEDSSFAIYLRDREIDVTSLDDGIESERAAEIRKIISIVATRHAFRTPDSGRHKQRVRSRKNPKLFVGAKSVFAMVEANPRWLIAIGTRLLDAADDQNRVGAADQNRELTKAANRFQAMLETIPCGKAAHYSETKSVAALIECIGNYFFKCVVLDGFNPEPPGSFVVDKNLNPAVVDVLGQAINVGAVVYVPDESDKVLVGDLFEKRFRLCYLLAAIYKFPIRLGRSVSLSYILREMTSESITTRGQQELFE